MSVLYLSVLVVLSLAVSRVQGQNNPCYYSYRVNGSYSPGCTVEPTEKCAPAPENYCFRCETLMDAIVKLPPVYACVEGNRHYSYKLLVADEDHQIDSLISFSATKGASVTFSGDRSRMICTEDYSGFIFKTDIVTLENVTVSNCSHLIQSTTKKDAISTYSFPVGLYIEGGSLIILKNVVVEVQPGVTGVVMYNPYRSSIINCSFTASGNDVYDGSLNGGGGFVFELTYCNPGITNCTSPISNSGQSIYMFENCIFSGHSAVFTTQKQEDEISKVTSGLDYNSFGKGGGLSIIVKGSASYKVLNITNCSFLDNTAQHGGGLFVSFLDTTSNNGVIITKSLFQGNTCPGDETGGLESSGGGIHLENLAFAGVEASFNNYIYLAEETTFVKNSAYVGGGLSLTSLNYLPSTMSNCVNCGIANITFTRNVAVFGSAIHLHQHQIFKDVPATTPTQFNIINTTFQDNHVAYTQPLSQSAMGAVYSNLHHIMFTKRVDFAGNEASALVMVNAHANFTDTLANFTGNTGIRGGAIALLGTSYMAVNQFTRMIFDNNKALFQGGAIYKQYIEQDASIQYANCFIKYRNTNNPGSFNFVGNQVLSDNSSNAIHTTSILPCRIPASEGWTPLCWTNWSYNGMSCINITSNAIKEYVTTDISINMILMNNNEVEAFPGWPFELNWIARDDLNATITDDVEPYITGNQ